jgi:hypothetical protein
MHRQTHKGLAHRAVRKEPASHSSAPRKQEGGLPIGSPVPPERAAELVRELEDKQLGKAIKAAVEIVEQYRAVAAAVVVNPDLNMTKINAILNSVIEKNLSAVINSLAAKNPPFGLDFLANSTVIRSDSVKRAAREALSTALSPAA